MSLNPETTNDVETTMPRTAWAVPVQESAKQLNPDGVDEGDGEGKRTYRDGHELPSR